MSRLGSPRLTEPNRASEIKEPDRRCCTPAALAAIPAEMTDLGANSGSVRAVPSHPPSDFCSAHPAQTCCSSQSCSCGPITACRVRPRLTLYQTSATTRRYLTFAGFFCVQRGRGWRWTGCNNHWSILTVIWLKNGKNVSADLKHFRNQLHQCHISNTQNTQLDLYKNCHYYCIYLQVYTGNFYYCARLYELGLPSSGLMWNCFLSLPVLASCFTN